jgi:predicted acetyltransferase
VRTAFSETARNLLTAAEGFVQLFDMARQGVQEERIEIVPVAVEQKSTLANLLELYSYDFSEFIDLAIGADGRFGYQDLEPYWTDPNRWPFLIHVDGKLAGFSLVRNVAQGRGTMWDMAEFFVMRGFRKRGVGMRAAMETFTRFSGRWQVRVMRTNGPACRFWTRAVHTFAGDTFRLWYETRQEREWMIFSFNSPVEG